MRGRNPIDAVEQVPVCSQHRVGLGHERVLAGRRDPRLDQRPRVCCVLVVELGMEVEVGRRRPARATVELPQPATLGVGDRRLTGLDRVVYDQSVEWLREAVNKARIGHTDRLKALKRLAEWGDEPSGA